MRFGNLDGYADTVTKRFPITTGCCRTRFHDDDIELASIRATIPLQAIFRRYVFQTSTVSLRGGPWVLAFALYALSFFVTLQEPPSALRSSMLTIESVGGIVALSLAFVLWTGSMDSRQVWWCRSAQVAPTGAERVQGRNLVAFFAQLLDDTIIRGTFPWILSFSIVFMCFSFVGVWLGSCQPWNLRGLESPSERMTGVLVGRGISTCSQLSLAGGSYMEDPRVLGLFDAPITIIFSVVTAPAILQRVSQLDRGAYIVLTSTCYGSALAMIFASYIPGTMHAYEAALAATRALDGSETLEAGEEEVLRQVELIGYSVARTKIFRCVAFFVLLGMSAWLLIQRSMHQDTRARLAVGAIVVTNEELHRAQSERRRRHELVAASKAMDEKMRTEEFRRALLEGTIGYASHALRNPLFVVKNLVRDLAEHSDPASLASQTLQIVYGEVRSMEKLTSDVLDHRKLLAGRISLASRPTDLRQLVRQTVEAAWLASDGVRSQGTRCALLVQQDVPSTVRTDAVRVRQIFDAAVGNAIRAVSKRGRVLVRLTVVERELGETVHGAVKSCSPYHTVPVLPSSSPPANISSSTSSAHKPKHDDRPPTTHTTATTKHPQYPQPPPTTNNNNNNDDEFRISYPLTPGDHMLSSLSRGPDNVGQRLSLSPQGLASKAAKDDADPSAAAPDEENALLSSGSPRIQQHPVSSVDLQTPGKGKTHSRSSEHHNPSGNAHSLSLVGTIARRSRDASTSPPQSSRHRFLRDPAQQQDGGIADPVTAATTPGFFRSVQHTLTTSAAHAQNARKTPEIQGGALRSPPHPASNVGPAMSTSPHGNNPPGAESSSSTWDAAGVGFGGPRPEQKRRFIRFEVRDTSERGLGKMDPSSLFEAFGLPGKTETNFATSSAGLGLPIASLVTQLLGGCIGLYDDSTVAPDEPGAEPLVSLDDSRTISSLQTPLASARQHQTMAYQTQPQTTAAGTPSSVSHHNLRPRHQSTSSPPSTTRPGILPVAARSASRVSATDDFVDTVFFVEIPMDPPPSTSQRNLASPVEEDDDDLATSTSSPDSLTPRSSTQDLPNIDPDRRFSDRSAQHPRFTGAAANTAAIATAASEFGEYERPKHSDWIPRRGPAIPPLVGEGTDDMLLHESEDRTAPSTKRTTFRDSLSSGKPVEVEARPPIDRRAQQHPELILERRLQPTHVSRAIVAPVSGMLEVDSMNKHPENEHDEAAAEDGGESSSSTIRRSASSSGARNVDNPAIGHPSTFRASSLPTSSERFPSQIVVPAPLITLAQPAPYTAPPQETSTTTKPSAPSAKETTDPTTKRSSVPSIQTPQATVDPSRPSANDNATGSSGSPVSPFGRRSRRGRTQKIAGPLGLSVLVVDDEVSVRGVITDWLVKRFGCTVTECSDGDEAIDTVQGGSKHFDVILMDIMMPRLRGDRAARALVDGGCTVPILAVTANAHLQGPDYDWEPFHSVVSKPFVREDLYRELKAVKSQSKN